MNRALASVAALSLSLLGGAPAHAKGWTYSEVSRVGDQGTTYLAVTAHQYHGVGLRCESGAVSIQYLTNDPMSDAQMKAINASGVRLALNADENDRRIEGEMQRVPQGAIFVARTQPQLLASLANAKGDLKLALEFGGTTAHQRSFALSGAAEALGTLRENCLE